MKEWMPIESAPRDKSRVLLFCAYAGVVAGYWDDDRYAKKPRPYWTTDKERVYGTRTTRDDQPTHWMPLPAPPTGASP